MAQGVSGMNLEYLPCIFFGKTNSDEVANKNWHSLPYSIK